MYKRRLLENKILKASNNFKVLLVTGARQVGKTSMLKALCNEQKRTYVSFDDFELRELANNDPKMFFMLYPLPILIDEVQKAPKIFEYIKLLVDASEETGQVWLTGSQQFLMMKGITESLAGRIGIYNMYPFSQREKDGKEIGNELDFSINKLINHDSDSLNAGDIFQSIVRGGYPSAYNLDSYQRNEYFDSYINSYLLRDVMEQENIDNIVRFKKFIKACASLNAQLLNYKTLADICGISPNTAKSWVNILVGLGIIYLLEPFYTNEIKRLVKTPKLYFVDTGLCTYLCKINDAEILLSSPFAGYYFENYVVTEFIKRFSYTYENYRLSFFRDSNGKEIDLIIEDGLSYHPLEIKLAAIPDKREVKKFTVLDNLQKKRDNGGIICMTDKVYPIDEKASIINPGII